jgi:3-oxoadipate enol-lactonase
MSKGRSRIFEQALQRIVMPTPVICGDEDDACIQPSIFLKQHIPASGLSMFPKTAHILDLEESALFNETLERFLGLAEAVRWPPRDRASKRASIPAGAVCRFHGGRIVV